MKFKTIVFTVYLNLRKKARKNMNCCDFDHNTFPMFLPTISTHLYGSLNFEVFLECKLYNVHTGTLKCATICIEIIFVFTRLA